MTAKSNNNVLPSSGRSFYTVKVFGTTGSMFGLPSCFSQQVLHVQKAVGTKIVTTLGRQLTAITAKVIAAGTNVVHMNFSRLAGKIIKCHC